MIYKTVIFKRFCYHYLWLVIILFTSCVNKIDAGEHAHPLGQLLHSVSSSIQSLVSGPVKLTPSEYITWVEDQKGVTFDSIQTNQFALSLTFHPSQLEAYTAARNNGEDPSTALSKYLDIQKDYYYCTADCFVKYESASSPIKKNDLLALIRQQLTVIKNNDDTLHTIITEAFPSYVMNQPNKLLILIPADSTSSYQISISGSAFQARDCRLNVSSTDIQSFPFIKL